MDVDNDGYRDLLITNGFPKDVTDKDYVMFKREVGAFKNYRSLIDSIPVLKVSNYAFQNHGDFSFSDKTKEWGMDLPSFSNGAAFADLDNDGDLDYVINNINDVASLYENTLYDEDEKSKNNYLRIKLKGGSKNKAGLGAKITIHHDGKVQYVDHSIYRGYLSTVEEAIHFGIGESKIVDTLTVAWPDGNFQKLVNLNANQVVEVKYAESQKGPVAREEVPQSDLYFRKVPTTTGLKYRHQEWDKIDFYRQRTLPHKFSQAGPGIAVGDVNGDQLEDFILGGSSLYDATVFTQRPDGGFVQSTLSKTTDKKSEDEGLLLFDADNDNDLDLYLVSGSYEGEAGEDRYEDRLYINDGKGNFKMTKDALPSTIASGSCVRAADFDGDGDLDLFVGGRVVPGSYPLAPESYLLRNDNGKFFDVTDEVATGLKHVGMITDALWTDFDGDKKIDLMLAGEFMPVTVFRNKGTGFAKVNSSGLENHSGWWNSISAADFDKDGDPDYIIGNLGLNNYYNVSEVKPLRVYANDFDANGSIDAIISCYFKSEEGDMREYPTHFWDELNSQSPKFRKQFSSYKQYGATSMDMLLKPHDTIGMLVLKANYFQSSYVENLGNGKFSIHPLPKASQHAPVNGTVITDVNADGNLDVMIIGNDYGNEVFSGRYDASPGLILLSDGEGGFIPVPPVKSGFKVDGDAKALAKLRMASGDELFIATQNRDSLRTFQLNNETKLARFFQPLPLDSRAEFEHEDGNKEMVEFYHGSGYLAQSTRAVLVPPNVGRIVVYDTKGNQRSIVYDQLAITADH
jgi:hypothetical protein